jgi:hypothetical protein
MGLSELFKSQAERARENARIGNEFNAAVPPIDNISDVLGQIEKQQQEDILAGLDRYAMPSFDANLAYKTSDESMNQVGNMLDVVSRYSNMPGSEYITPEVLAFANKLGDVQNNLRSSTSRYGAGMDDINRARIANQLNRGTDLSFGNMLNAMLSTSQSRRSNAKISDMQRAGSVRRMTNEMQAKLSQLKKTAERARQEGDRNALADALLEIGRLVGFAAIQGG